MAKLQRGVYAMLFISLIFSGLYFAAPFLIPLTLAGIFSMVFIRLCNWLERKGLQRGWASLVCILVFVLAVSLIISLLYWQLGNLTENLEEMKSRLTSMVSSFRNWINQKLNIDSKQQEDLIKAGSSNTGNLLASFASGLMGIAVNTILVLVYMYLSLYYRTHIKNFILKLVPDREEHKASVIVHESGKVAQHYLSGLGAMIGVLWILYGIGFSILGVESAIFFAVLCGLLEIVPFVGNLTGTCLTLLAVMAQGGDSKMLLGVLIVYGLVQFLQTYILEPLIVGEQVNINPLFTILSIVLGEFIWGVAGMILAIPILGIIKIICDRIPELKPFGFLIGPANPKTNSENWFSKLFKQKK
ncbi:AI-2E family transporter [Pedobacter aquatilis]|uniref:AI-2E family transporter n=1 Tax=Pedobacter aquatilis TaxID=351343 RepID=UPI0025B300AB|nr:AI-2E family transporter [Pedobacter aquatilis]MDN3586246.1 AI-2E family transporter [Pedobacter aquatilis]